MYLSVCTEALCKRCNNWFSEGLVKRRVKFIHIEEAMVKGGLR